MEEDSSKNPDADVVVDKLSGLALKQQKISEDHRRKLLKQRQKLRVEGRTVTTKPLTMQLRDPGSPCTSCGIKHHNKFARFRYILAKDP